jgi:hypothetical protein
MAWDAAMSRLLRGIAMSLGLPWVLASVSVPVGLGIALALARSRPQDSWILTVLGDPWYVFAAFTIAVMAVKIVAPVLARCLWRSHRAGAVCLGLLTWLALFSSVLIMNLTAPLVVPQFLEPPLDKLMTILWLVIEAGTLLWTLALVPAAWREPAVDLPATPMAVTTPPSLPSDPPPADRWSPAAPCDPRAELLVLLVELAAGPAGEIDADTWRNGAGVIVTSQGALARHLGWSKGRLSHLRTLAEDHDITLDVRGNRTHIRLPARLRPNPASHESGEDVAPTGGASHEEHR